MMGMRVGTLFLCLGLVSCKFMSSASFRGQHKGNSKESADANEGTPAAAGSETPSIPSAAGDGNPAKGPTVPEDSFKIPDPAPETPLEGTVVRRPGGGIEISGNIAGIWDKSIQPVYITGDVVLKTGKSLAIKEGVQVIVSPEARFYVEGAQLKIVGTAAEPVRFTSTAADQNWQGIRVCSAADCNSEDVRGKLEVRYALFEKARKADTNPNDVTGRHGGVFYIRSTETLIIEDSTFQNNFGLEAGGALQIIADNPNILFRRNTLKDNSNDGGGGALQITNGRNLRLEGNTFIGNSSKAEGGAIALIDSAAITLVGNTFENNRAATGGGALYCDGHGVTIQVDASNTFKGNAPVDTLCKDE